MVILIPCCVRLNGFGMGTKFATLSGASVVMATSWYWIPSRAGEPTLPAYLHPLQPFGLSDLSLSQVVGPVALSFHWITLSLVTDSE